MAGNTLIDPFDNAGPVKPQKSAANTGLIDPFDDPAFAADLSRKSGVSTQGGTYGTANTLPPGRNLVGSENPASLKDTMMSATMEDPQAKLEYLASRRFPDDPTAMNRYGYIGEDLVFLNDAGEYEKELTGKNWEGNLARGAAKVIGGAGLPMAGATIGGILGGAPGAALGGAGGKAYQKLVARILGDDKETATQVGADLAGEMVLSGAGWKAGELFSDKIVDRRVVKDIGRFDSKKAEALQKMAKDRFGVDLTPAETTELGSLVNQQQHMARGFDEAGDTIKQFMQRRAGQVDAAVDKYLGTTPPAEAVGASARKVGQSAIDAAKKERSAQARPIYDEFVNDSTRLLPRDAMKQFENDPVLKRVFADVRKEGLFVDDAVPDHSVTFVDSVKKQLDSMIGAAERAGEGSRAAALKSKRAKLLEVADKYEPGYAEARKAFASASPAVDALESGIEGVLANIPDSGLRGAARKILSARDASPIDVDRARKQFVAQNKEGDWNNVVKQYLRDIWEGPATKDVQAGENLRAGANFRKTVFGTKRQKEMMREAMGPDNYKDFENLMDVLEATGRVPGGQSMTQPAQEYAKSVKRESAPIATAVEDVLKIRLLDWWADSKATTWRNDLAKVITSPEGIGELKKLKKLRQISPGSRDAISTVITAFEKAGIAIGTGSRSDESSLQAPPR